MIKEKLLEIANDNKLKATTKSINQTQRNNLMNELLDNLLETLIEHLQLKKDNEIFIDDTGLIQLGRVDKAIEIRLDHEMIGDIPIKISISLPNFDILTLEDNVLDYQEKLKEKALKLIEKEESKKKKIALDKEMREKQKEKENASE